VAQVVLDMVAVAAPVALVEIMVVVAEAVVAEAPVVQLAQVRLV
jgi:hypothetical protein